MGAIRLSNKSEIHTAASWQATVSETLYVFTAMSYFASFGMRADFHHEADENCALWNRQVVPKLR